MDSVGPKEARVRWSGHWRTLANTTEPSMCGGYAMRPFVELLWPLVSNICYTSPVGKIAKTAPFSGMTIGTVAPE